jgi:AcrR family transcriptional regulator
VPARSAETDRPHAPTSATGRRAKTASRADEIRLAALELFAVKGYLSTTMADIGDAVGMRGPSVYKHVRSKPLLLRDMIIGTMDRLIADQRAAIESTDDIALQLRRAAEAHVEYHAGHRFEAFVGTREIDRLDPTSRKQVLKRRAAYEQGIRSLIIDGIADGCFTTTSVQLASYAILDMGMGVAVWYREDGSMSPAEIASEYGAIALRIVGAPLR